MSCTINLTLDSLSTSNKRKAEDDLQLQHKQKSVIIDLTNIHDEDEELLQNKKVTKKFREDIQTIKKRKYDEDVKQYHEAMNKKLAKVMRKSVQSLSTTKKKNIYEEAIKNRNHPWFISASHNSMNSDGLWEYCDGKWRYYSSSNDDNYLKCIIDEIVNFTMTK